MASSFSGKITWLGHAMFVVESKGGKRLVFDPFIEPNPKFPKGYDLSRVDVIAPTHGHDDHFGASGVDLAKKTGASVVCIFELALWLGSKGVKNVSGMNKGGTQKVSDFTISMTPAEHSGGIGSDLNPFASPCGFVVEVDGFRIYHAGDTAPFSDMRIIAELSPPDIALLPIGDFYTMGPKGAALACEMLKVPRVIPMHWGTSPLLTGAPDALRAEIRNRGGSTEVVELRPGESWPA